MGINLSNFLSSKSKNERMIDFQDLDHIDGLSISVVSANLYNDKRDDLSMFYFRDGANYASVYTKSKIVSENIKWNLSQKSKKIYSLLVNTRNANAFTGKQGYDSLKKLSEIISVLSVLFFVIGLDNEKLKGPIGVSQSSPIPVELLNLLESSIALS